MEKKREKKEIKKLTELPFCVLSCAHNDHQFDNSFGNSMSSPQTTTTARVKAAAYGCYTLNLTTNGSGFEPKSSNLAVTIIPNSVISSIVADMASCGAPKSSARGAQSADTIVWSEPSGGIPAGTESKVDLFPTKTGTYSAQPTRNGCASNVASGDICFAFVPRP